MSSGRVPDPMNSWEHTTEKVFDRGDSCQDEFLDKLADLAQPLRPAAAVWDNDDDDVIVAGSNRGGRKLAKDKRKLREKRRSTGVVQFSEGETSSDHLASESVNDNDDHVTSLNTTYNELPVVSPTESNAEDVQRFGSDRRVMCNAPVTAAQDVSDTTPLNDSAPVGDQLLNRPPPTVPPKPKVPVKNATGTQFSGVSKTSQQSALRRPESDRQLLVNRLAAVEKLLEIERKDNMELRQQLSRYEERVIELETEVEALNKDLDLADEEYAKLEQENDVLLQAISHQRSS